MRGSFYGLQRCSAAGGNGGSQPASASGGGVGDRAEKARFSCTDRVNVTSAPRSQSQATSDTGVIFRPRLFSLPGLQIAEKRRPPVL